MASERKVLRAVVRTAVGVVGLALGVALVGAAGAVTLPQHRQETAGVRVTPRPADRVLACPGPLLALASEASKATTASSFGTAALVAASGEGAPDARALTPKDDAAGTDNGAPTSLSVSASGATTPPLVAGSQYQNARTEDLAGTAVAACTESAASSWLVAGATTLGQTSLVRLTNPGETAADVTLTAYGEHGPVSSGADTSVTVAPHSQSMVPLAGIAPGLADPVVHVRSTGGRVAASLQQSVVHGLAADGVELAGPSTAPATAQTIPGVVVTGGEPALRLFSPGGEAHVRIGVVGEKGTEGGTSTKADVAADTGMEVALKGLKKGVYTVTVSSDAPVVAAARAGSTHDDARDFAWFGAAAPLDGEALVAARKGESLHLANPGAEKAAVTLTAPGGHESTVVVPGASAVAVPLTASGGYRLAGADGLAASVSLAGDGALSSFTVRPPGALAGSIVVHPR